MMDGIYAAGAILLALGIAAWIDHARERRRR